MMDREVESFRKLYPEADIELTYGQSREGVAALMSKTADLVVAARELEPEERSVVVKGGMELEGYRVGKDAICVIVNPANPLLSISLDDLRRIFSREARTWPDVMGKGGAIVPVIPPPGGDLWTAFFQRVLGGKSPTAPAVRADADSAVARIVARDPNAIGFVSSVHVQDDVKVLRVSALTGLPDWKPDAERVYKGDYPLSRIINMYVRSKGPKLANGLVTFVSSLDGQKIVHEAGFVPTAVPVHFVRRSLMLGSH